MSDSALLRSPELLDRQRSRLLVVDVQEKLIPAIHGGDDVVRRISFLLSAAELMQIPIVVSEQYPQGLGKTVSALANHTAVGVTLEKVRFSASDCLCEHIGLSARIAPDAHDGLDQIVLAGIESHVCMLQTGQDLLARGFRVYVSEDAAGSGTRRDHDIGICRLRDAGATICTAESVAFEWCESAAAEEFKSVSRLVRDLRP